MSLEYITKDRRFWPLFWTQFLGAMNDNFFKNALVILITYKNVQLMGLSSASVVAMAGGVFILPFFLFSATAGQIADRYEKSTVIRCTKISEFIIMCIAAAGFIFDSYQLLMIVLFCMGAQSAFFGPLKYGILPNLLKSDELVLGNAYVGGGTFLAILIGTIVGGFAASFEGAGQYIGGGILLVSFFGILTSWKIIKVNNADKDLKVDYTLFKPTLDIIKLTARDKRVFFAVLGISWFWFLGAAILSLLPGLVKDVFGGAAMVGTIFLATFTIGMGLGSFLCNKLSFKRVEVGMVPHAALGMSIFLLDLFYVGHTWQGNASELLGISDFFAQNNSIRAVVDLFLMSTFGGMYIIPQFAFIQHETPQSEVSRIIAGNNIWNTIFMVTAAVSIMVLDGMGVSIPVILGIFGAINVTSFFLLHYFVYSEESWRFICWCLGKIMYDIEIEGQENIPLEGPVVLASNHVSFVDWIFVMSVSPRPVRFVIDYNYYNVKTGPFWFKQAGLIPIATRRESEDVLLKAYDQMAKTLEEERCLGIFPEGFLSRDGKLRPFQPGIKKIVGRTPAPIIPMAIDGIWGSWFSHAGKGPLRSFESLRKRKVKVTISKPIQPEELDLDVLRDKIHAHLSIKGDE